jgi:tetratricopeptide (TPR) repeat protein
VFAQLKDAHEMALSIGDGRTLALITYIIGKLYLGEGRLSEARAYMEQALPRMREVGDRENEAELLIMLSRVCRRQGDLDEAPARCEQALRIGSGSRDWYFKAEALHERVRVMAALGS